MQRAWPYLAPYAALLTCAELGGWLPKAFTPPLLALRVLVPALLVGLAWRSGAFPELRPGPRGREVWHDVAFGLAIAALWLAPYLLVPRLPRGAGFDPNALGAGGRTAWIALRLVGFVAVSPLVEELFVRSFLHRAAEVWPEWRAFAARPIGRPQPRAFLVTAAWFTLSHQPWEWWVALPTGALLNAWLYRSGRLRSVWLAHAVANGAIGGLVALGPFDLWAFL